MAALHTVATIGLGLAIVGGALVFAADSRVLDVVGYPLLVLGGLTELALTVVIVGRRLSGGGGDGG